MGTCTEGTAIASSTRWLVGTVAVVLVVAVVGLVAASVREPSDLPAGSPETVVQRYLRAVAEGDPDSAYDTYAPELRERCERHRPERLALPDERMAFEADLLDTRRGDDTVQVRVRITEFSGEPPFGGGGYDHTEVFVVERVDGSWGIARASWPYGLCPS
ncbi:MAG: hypothetical protein M3N52_09520 [Actinomycetota bacterium]|nr:hypothetical protein [Actinomycetota bacterium]